MGSGSFLGHVLFAIALLAPSAHAAVTVQGKIVTSAGAPVENNAVDFHLQVLAPDANGCVLYDETRTLNMTGSGGLFSIALGDGNGTANAPTTYTFDQSLSNKSAFTVNSGF